MRITHAVHITHVFGYCDLYGVDSEKDEGGIMGETSYEQGFSSFNKGDPIHPRRIPPNDLGGDARLAWFKGWGAAQEMWKIAMRNRGK